MTVIYLLCFGAATISKLILLINQKTPFLGKTKCHTYLMRLYSYCPLITQIMQSDLQLNRKPVHSHNPRPPVNGIFQLLKQKKAQFSKELEHLDSSSIALPALPNEKNNIKRNSEVVFVDQTLSDAESEIDHKQIMNESEKSGRNKFKLALDQVQGLQKSRFSNRDRDKKLQQYNPRNVSDYHRPHNKVFTVKSYNRTKTQTKVKQPKKSNYSRNTTSIQKARPSQQQLLRYDQPIKKFCLYIQNVPRNMKERNQDNLTLAINELQRFNPFFNRNTRIVNVCLLKMGNIVFRQSPFELYKCGEELNYFYIILLGKVKIMEKGFKRVCETGETVLQEILFGQQPRKYSLERAKVINSAYLLQMKIQQYKKLKEQLIKHGLRLHFQQMESVIKRNLIIKNWMRNKKK